MFPDDRTIALLRTAVSRFLKDTCDVYRTSAAGRNSAASAIPCLINDYAPGTNPQSREANEDILSYVLTTLYSQALEINDEVIHNGVTYQVYELLEDKSPMVFRQARMRKMT